MQTVVSGRFPGAAGGEIFWQRWLPSDGAAAVVVIAHGYAEHSGRYVHVAARLTAAGYAVYALDHRGHGRSDGARGNLERMAHVRADLHELVSTARAEHADLPVFLLGHSMGTLVALDYLVSGSENDLAGLVLSGAAVDPTTAKAAEKLAAKLLSVVAPNVGVASLDATGVSRDPQEVAKYQADPFNYHGKIPARTGAELLSAIDRVRAGLTSVELPVLVMHGTEDRLASPDGSWFVAKQLGSSDVTLLMYDGLYHEIFNEPEQDAVFDDLMSWLDDHREDEH